MSLKKLATAKKDWDSSTMLRRYTSFASALDILTTRKITLLSPDSWDDKNDTAAIERFRVHQEYPEKTIKALCLTEAEETYHHWKLFSQGQEGVCIKFRALKLKEYLELFKNGMEESEFLYFERVQYILKEKFDESISQEKDFLFLKRRAYKAEEEVRIVFGSKLPDGNVKKLNFELDAISSISLSPWLPAALHDNIKAIFRRLVRGTGIRVYGSSITSSSEWQDKIRNFKQAHRT
jgi:hypothetical protein